MKIEKISDTKIRCTLTKEDLESRHIKLSELAYGSDKAKLLFRDMMQQANSEVGFEAEDMPLMIEAVPMSADSIILIISKVEYPDELDTRFSKFTEPDDFDEFLSATDTVQSQTANDILNLFKEADTGLDKEKKTDSQKEKDHTKNIDIYKLFCFKKLDVILRTAKILSTFELSENSLYIDRDKDEYYLVLHKGSMSPEDFNRVCNILSEYATQFAIGKASLAYFEEHLKALVKHNAIQTVAAI